MPEHPNISLQINYLSKLVETTTTAHDQILS